MLDTKKKFNGGIQIMIWGMIGYEGPIAFCEVDGRLNSDKYIDDILKKYVICNKKLKN